jgi:hypothetical protein
VGQQTVFLLISYFKRSDIHPNISAVRVPKRTCTYLTHRYPYFEEINMPERLLRPECEQRAVIISK